MFMKLYDLIVLVSVPRKYFFEIFSPNRKSAILDFVRIPSFYKSSFEAFTRHVNSWDVTATFKLLNFRFDIVFRSGRCTVAQYCPLVSFFDSNPLFSPFPYTKSHQKLHMYRGNCYLKFDMHIEFGRGQMPQHCPLEYLKVMILMTKFNFPPI